MTRPRLPGSAPLRIHASLTVNKVPAAMPKTKRMPNQAQMLGQSLKQASIAMVMMMLAGAPTLLVLRKGMVAPGAALAVSSQPPQEQPCVLRMGLGAAMHGGHDTSQNHDHSGHPVSAELLADLERRHPYRRRDRSRRRR